MTGRASGTLDPARLCIAAIAVAERQYGLPHGLLRAIADVESGRRLSDGEVVPWPWTINAEGQGQYFTSQSQAADWVRSRQVAGVQSVDVGCMQVNLLHHPQAFRTLQVAFDPRANTDYAARFLLSLFAASGDWTTAIGYYHSRTAVLAEPYRARVQAALGVKPIPSCAARVSALQLAWRATLSRDGADMPVPYRSPLMAWHEPAARQDHRVAGDPGLKPCGTATAAAMARSWSGRGDILPQPMALTSR